MRRISHVIMLVSLFCLIMEGAELQARGGRGGRGGGGIKHGGGVTKPSNTFRGNRHAHGGGRGLTTRRFGAESATPSGRPTSTFNQFGNEAPLHTGERPWSRHHARELQKLDHRKQVADHLRRVSAQNGNEHLNQVATDMDQRAEAHYEKQVNKIKQKYGVNEFEEPITEGAGGEEELAEHPLEDPANQELENLPDDAEPNKLTGRENALFRQVRNEERKLAKRMETVEQMRQLAEQSGDDEMLQAADRLEEWAISHFDQRMARITDFQQRHDLPPLSQTVSP